MLYVKVGTTTYPSRVFWSQPAEPDALPSTFDATDDTADAGWVDLADTAGDVVDCLPLGDVNIIYKEDC